MHSNRLSRVPSSHRHINTRTCRQILCSHKYSTCVTPLSTWLCGKLLVPVIKIKPKRKWCKWNLTKEIILCVRVSSSSSSRLRCRQTSLRIRSSIRKLILHLRPFVWPFQTWSILEGAQRLLEFARHQTWLRLPLQNTRHNHNNSRERMLPPTHPTPAYMQQIFSSFAETKDGACAAVSSVIRLLKPCNSISGHPTHSGSRGRNVSPRNCSVSGPCEIPVRL